MLIKKKKKRNPAELVTSAARVGSWYDRLSDEDKYYIEEVVVAMQDSSHVSISSVAQSLINELNLTASKLAVRDTLKKML